MPRHIRVIPIAVMTWPDEATRTSNSASLWIAEATVEGRTYTARSRHGPANQLARQLVAAGFPDRPMVLHYHELAGTMTSLVPSRGREPATPRFGPEPPRHRNHPVEHAVPRSRRCRLPQLNPVEPPWYGPVCPVVGGGWHREVSPYPDLGWEAVIRRARNC